MFGQIFDHTFGQVFEQIFGKDFDQGLGEGKNYKYSAQYYAAQGKHIKNKQKHKNTKNILPSFCFRANFNNTGGLLIGGRGGEARDRTDGKYSFT